MVVISEKLQELFIKRTRNETFLDLYIFYDVNIREFSYEKPLKDQNERGSKH